MLYKNYDSLSETEKKSIINKLYVDNKESLAIIAQKLSTYANKIRRDAVKYGINLRDKSVAQKTALKSGRHKHPTKGTKRDDETKAKIGQAVMENWDELSSKEKQKRQDKARKNWNSLSDNKKDFILKAANQAVRQSSKTGSKLEKYLLYNLISDGYKVDFHKEQILSNTKLQIDLFLPTINVAIEVDGPSHFKEVWGKDTLKKNIRYDNKKTGLILGKGLVLIRIKQTMDFSRARASLIYTKLVEILQKVQKDFPQPGHREIKIGDN